MHVPLFSTRLPILGAMLLVNVAAAHQDEPPLDHPQAAETLQSEEGQTNAETPLDLASIQAEHDPIGRIAARYRSDHASLERFYFVKESSNTRARMRKFYVDWLTALIALPAESLSEDDREAMNRLKDNIVGDLAQLEQTARADEQAALLVPFAKTILALAEDRQHVRRIDPQEAAGQLSEVSRTIEQMRTSLHAATDEGGIESSPHTRRRAAEFVKRLRGHLRHWYEFHNGYDPAFTWWMRAPYEEANQQLAEYASDLDTHEDTDEHAASPEREPTAGADTPADAGHDDVPDLVELLREEPTRMAVIVERFQSELRGAERDRRGRSGRGGRRGRRSDAEPPAAPRRPMEDLLRRWQAALEDLDFDRLSHSEQVDYLLLSNQVEYRLRRLEHSAAERGGGRLVPVDESGIAGRPIGRNALLAELAHEMIDYTPEELIEIAEKEYAWCQAELRKASREMGLGDDWRAAVEKVKEMHVAPGEQPYLIHDLAWEAIDYVKSHDLVTVPPIAAETWRMQMMSPERQLINPFFTGGPTISVSFPTDAMSHEAKLQSMRGNNIPFARATVHHELIPGHNLQAYMNARYATHRRPFATPFWGEGWALYWEMLLYERGFAATPEDRVGFLVWRQHRCARIIFSLSYHLGWMTPAECIHFLVEKVGFDEKNATAEVRRSVENATPLYQAAYMIGGLQFRALHHELVESGKMTSRDFHDEILRQGSIPVVMVRALLTEESLSRDPSIDWRFYEADENNLPHPVPSPRPAQRD